MKLALGIYSGTVIGRPSMEDRSFLLGTISVSFVQGHVFGLVYGSTTWVREGAVSVQVSVKL